MKSAHDPNSLAPPAILAPRFRRIPALVASLLLFPALTGCVTVRTHHVSRTVVADHVLNATLAQLVAQVDQAYSALQTINASVDITATTGGAHQGEVKEIPTFAGYIFLRKPADLHLLMLLPVVRSRALEMVADGKTFKLLIPPRNQAYEGSETLTTSSKNGLENIRPGVIRDALLIPPVQPGELVSLTENDRLLPPARGRKEMTEEPDYDLTVSRIKAGRELQTVRVVHISRLTLQPYQQDIYDPAGRIVTTVAYNRYQNFSNIAFPMSILITRPIDEYTLKIDFTKLTLNQKLDDEQFVLKIPENIPIQKM